MTAARLQEHFQGLDMAGQGLLSKRGSTQLDPSLTMPHTRGLSRLQSQPKDFIHDALPNHISRNETAESAEQPDAEMARQTSVKGMQEAQPVSHPIDFQESEAPDSNLKAMQQQDEAAPERSMADLPEPASDQSHQPETLVPEPAHQIIETAWPDISTSPATAPATVDETAASGSAAASQQQADVGHLVVRQSSMRGDMMQRRSRPSRGFSSGGESTQGHATTELAVWPSGQLPSTSHLLSISGAGEGTQAAQPSHVHDGMQAASHEAASAIQISNIQEVSAQAGEHDHPIASVMTSSNREAVQDVALPASAGIKKQVAKLQSAASANSSSEAEQEASISPACTASLKLSQLQQQLESVKGKISDPQQAKALAAKSLRPSTVPDKQQFADVPVTKNITTAKPTSTPSSAKPASTSPKVISKAGNDAAMAASAPLPDQQHKQPAAASLSSGLSHADHSSAAAGNDRRSYVTSKAVMRPKASSNIAALQEPKEAADGTKQPSADVPANKAARLPVKATSVSASASSGEIHTNSSKARPTNRSATATTAVGLSKRGSGIQNKHEPTSSDQQMPGNTVSDNQISHAADQAKSSLPSSEQEYSQPTRTSHPATPGQEASSGQQALPSIERRSSARSIEAASPALKPPAILRQQSRFPDGSEPLSSSFRIKKGDVGSTSGNRVQWKLESEESGGLAAVQLADASMLRAVSRAASMLGMSSSATQPLQGQQSDASADPSAPDNHVQEVRAVKQHGTQDSHAEHSGAQPAASRQQDAAEADGLQELNAASTNDQPSISALRPAKSHSTSLNKPGRKPSTAASPAESMTNEQASHPVLPARAKSQARVPGHASQPEQTASSSVSPTGLAQLRDSLMGAAPGAADAAAPEGKLAQTKASTSKAVKPAAIAAAQKLTPKAASAVLPTSGSLTKTVNVDATSSLAGTASQAAKPIARRPSASMSTIKKMSLADLKAQAKAAAKTSKASEDHATESAQQLPQMSSEHDTKMVANAQKQQHHAGAQASSSSAVKQAPLGTEMSGEPADRVQHTQGSVHARSPVPPQHELGYNESSSQETDEYLPELIKAYGGPPGTASFEQPAASLLDIRSLAADHAMPIGAPLARRASAAAAVRPRSAASSQSSLSTQRSSVMSMAEAKVMAANLKAANEELGKPDLRRRLSLVASTSGAQAASANEKLTDYQALLADANLLQSMRSSSAARLSGDHDFSSSWLSGRPPATPKFALSTPGIPARNWHLTLRQYPGKDEPGEEHRPPAPASRSKLSSQRASISEIDAI